MRKTRKRNGRNAYCDSKKEATTKRMAFVSMQMPGCNKDEKVRSVFQYASVSHQSSGEIGFFGQPMDSKSVPGAVNDLNIVFIGHIYNQGYMTNVGIFDISSFKENEVAFAYRVHLHRCSMVELRTARHGQFKSILPEHILHKSGTVEAFFGSAAIAIRCSNEAFRVFNDAVYGHLSPECPE